MKTTRMLRVSFENNETIGDNTVVMTPKIDTRRGTARWQDALAWWNSTLLFGTPIPFAAAGVLAGIYLFALLVPWLPASGASNGYFDYFDFSWMLVLHDALATGKQFGEQIILPYGPLGFIAASVYDPRTYLILVIIRIVIAGAVFHAMWVTARKLIQHAWAALAWFFAIITIMAGSPDHFFPICAVLLLVLYFVVDEHKMSLASWAMVGVLAAASLIKVNFLLQSGIVVAAVSLDGMVRPRDRGMIVPVAYVILIFSFYLLARQSPASLGRFIWGWAQVSAGHVEAVGLPGADIDLISYLIVAALVLFNVAELGWRGGGRIKFLPAAALAGVLLLLYKHSFVRQDLRTRPSGRWLSSWWH